MYKVEMVRIVRRPDTLRPWRELKWGLTSSWDRAGSLGRYIHLFTGSPIGALIPIARPCIEIVMQSLKYYGAAAL